MKLGPCDAAIVDLDGTLVDTMGDFVVALNRMLVELSPDDFSAHTLDAATVGRMVGKGSEHLVKSVLNHLIRYMPQIRWTQERLRAAADTLLPSLRKIR